ncbi:hypothetical protein FA95DRAFT_1460450, partial [Auriscalpium vulgare]
LSPVWRIKGLDPHTDTPVEILHVVLLGFVKYFWRDAIARVNDDQKAVLITRLNSFDVSGLGMAPLAGQTLVQYAGSLTGRDFRAISQAAPFVLYDLVPQECFETWLALCKLIPLIWQPHITDLDAHITNMQAAIDHFLNCTARWTPRWFNKPKFHIIRHLPDHVRRFGPAILFATEAFESFNAVVRSQSVHSNRHAPSRDLANGFSHCNRIRHMFSEGVFVKAEGSPLRQARYSKMSQLAETDWLTIGSQPRNLVQGGSAQHLFLQHYLGLHRGQPSVPGSVPSFVQLVLATAQHLPTSMVSPEKYQFRTCKDIVLTNGDLAEVGAWILARNGSAPSSQPLIGRVTEIVQVSRTAEALQGKAQFILLEVYRNTTVALKYGFPRLVRNGWVLVQARDSLCSVNVQHNCPENACDTSREVHIRQERELTAHTRAAVRHYNPDDLVLNTAQMHSAEHVQQFRVPDAPIDRELAIVAGAATEVQSKKKKTTAA